MYNKIIMKENNFSIIRILAKEEAKISIKKNFKYYMFAILVYSFIMGVGSAILGLWNQPINFNDSTLYIPNMIMLAITGVIQFIILPLFAYGVYKAFRDIYQSDKQVNPLTLFAAFKDNFFNIAWVNIVSMVLIYGAIGLGILAIVVLFMYMKPDVPINAELINSVIESGANYIINIIEGASVTWNYFQQLLMLITTFILISIIVLLISGVISILVSVRLIFINLILLDNPNEKLMSVLKKSRLLTKGRFFDILLFKISFIVWNLVVSAIAIGLGMIPYVGWIIAIFPAMILSTYRMLSLVRLYDKYKTVANGKEAYKLIEGNK